MYMKTQSIVIYTTERSVIEFLGARDVCQIVPKWNIIIGALSYWNVDIRRDKSLYIKKCELCFLCVYSGVRLDVAGARAAGWFPGKALRPGLDPFQYLTFYTHHTIVPVFGFHKILCLEFISLQGDNVC